MEWMIHTHPVFTDSPIIRPRHIGTITDTNGNCPRFVYLTHSHEVDDNLPRCVDLRMLAGSLRLRGRAISAFRDGPLSHIDVENERPPVHDIGITSSRA